MNKKCALLIALLLLLVPLATTLADSLEDAVQCGDLAEADCAIKKSNSAVMDELESFAIALSMAMDIQGADPSENVSITLEGAGSVALEPALMEAASALETAAGMDAAAMSALVNELLGGLSAEMYLDLTMAGADETSELPLNLLVKDGVVAVNMAAFADEADAAVAGWLGIALADVMDSAEQEADMTAVEMKGPDYGALAGAITIVRLPNSEVHGSPVAVFQTTLDSDALLESFGLADLSGALGADAAAMEFVGGASLHVLEYISLADSYTQRMEVAMTTMDEAQAETAPFSMNMTMRMDLSAFNEPVDVLLPEDVFVMPLAMMMQMGDQ